MSASVRLAGDKSRPQVRESRKVLLGFAQEPVADLWQPGQPALYHECLFRILASERTVLQADAILPSLAAVGSLALLDHVIVRLALERLQMSIDLTLGCNLSAETLQDDRHWDRLLRLVKRNGQANRRLVFEISECCPLHRTPRVAEKLRSLQAAGCRVALDDFGAGYSLPHFIGSLSFDWDMIKIDRAQLREGDVRGHAPSLRDAVIAARRFSKIVVVEGIESRRDLAVARDSGASHGQGWLWKSEFRQVWSNRSSPGAKRIIAALFQSGAIVGRHGELESTRSLPKLLMSRASEAGVDLIARHFAGMSPHTASFRGVGDNDDQ